jgi:hypothetical protein
MILCVAGVQLASTESDDGAAALVTVRMLTLAIEVIVLFCSSSDSLAARKPSSMPAR